MNTILPCKTPHLNSSGHLGEGEAEIQMTGLFYVLGTDRWSFEVLQTCDEISALPATSSVTVLLGKLVEKYPSSSIVGQKTGLAAKDMVVNQRF